MARTPTLLHEHDEALSVATFLHGIAVYEAAVAALADAPPDTDARAEAGKAARAAAQFAQAAQAAEGAGEGRAPAEPAAKKAKQKEGSGLV